MANARDFEGETAIVTGAASGIGQAIAERFAAEGARVVVADVDVEGGRATVDSLADAAGEAVFVETDVSDTDDVESLASAAVDAFGSIDVLVNNAGGSFDDDNLHRVDDATLDHVLAVNLRGPIVCSRAVLPRMVETGGGAIVNVSSVNGLRGIGLAAYSSAKAGLLGLTRVVAAQYGRHGIRVNAVAPGTIVTPASSSKLADEDAPLRETWVDQYPLGRLGRPEDVAEAALFLADDDRAGWITGVELPVDGGLDARGIDNDLEVEMYATDEPVTRER